MKMNILLPCIVGTSCLVAVCYLKAPLRKAKSFRVKNTRFIVYSTPEHVVKNKNLQFVKPDNMQGSV